MTVDTPRPRSHLPIRPEWLALSSEPIIDPALPIIDPHHHLWDQPAHRYLLPELLADVQGGHDIRATVFIECKAMYRADAPASWQSLGETEFVNGIAAMSASGRYGSCRVASGIVANVDLQAGDDVPRLLEAHAAAGGGRLRGIRNITAWHADPAARGSVADPPPGLLLDAAFRRGFAHLAAHALTFDAWMYHTQLGELQALAHAFPGTTIILNHVGGPIGIGPYAGRRDEVFSDWRASIRELARCENLQLKIGGFGMRLFGFGLHEHPAPPTSQQMADTCRPYVETAIDAFGPRRCMFESNFPVDKGVCSYATLWNTFKRLTAGCSADERTELFSGTAARAYRLPPIA